MPQMQGKNSVLHIWDSAGTSRNISGDLNSVTLTYTRENVDVTTFGDDAMQRLSGLRDATLSIAGVWNTGTGNINDVMDDLMNGSVITLVRWMPGGSTAGCPFWTGCFLANSYEENSNLTGPVAFTAAFQFAAGSLSASTV